MLLVMSLICKHLTKPLYLYIAIVATVINPYGCNCMLENFIMLLWLTLWLPSVESYIITFVVMFTLWHCCLNVSVIHCCVRPCIMNVINFTVCM
jgi:hypothetical protein